MNRLISATSSQGWSQGFNYDGFGNLTAKTALQGSVPVFSAAFDPATNRQVGIGYDANGNQLTDTAGYSSLQYDVENRLVWAQKGNQPPANGYGYDPDNRRVYRATLDYTNDQWTFVLGEMVTYYGVGGQKLVSYYMSVNGSTMTLGSTGVPNVYFGPRHVRHGGSSGNPTTAASDRLGSFGSYYPYGEERSSTGNNTERFATYYRDADTGLDYAVNRYYNSVSGRFLSPDPYKASGGPADPGSWNRYAYVQSDPRTASMSRDSTTRPQDHLILPTRGTLIPAELALTSLQGRRRLACGPIKAGFLA